MEVHPPHHPLHSWKDFFIHIATITVGLLIAVGLEQSVEALHHRHQRHQLQEDLRAEAERNQRIILRDLKMADQEQWHRTLIAMIASAPVKGGKLSVTLPATQCKPGTLNTPYVRYYAPSEAVWTTAKESGLAALLPAEEAQVYARLAHNDELLSGTRDHVAVSCDKVDSLESRFAVKSADGKMETWVMTPEQADHLSEAAAETHTALRALVFRLRWTLGYEQAILNGIRNVDETQMISDQAETNAMSETDDSTAH